MARLALEVEAIGHVGTADPADVAKSANPEARSCFPRRRRTGSVFGIRLVSQAGVFDSLFALSHAFRIASPSRDFAVPLRLEQFSSARPSAWAISGAATELLPVFPHANAMH